MSQSEQPAAQEPIAQTPALQAAAPLAAAQAVPQPPQLARLVLMLTSQPLAAFLSQSAKPALHDPIPHTPAAQLAVALANGPHACPHAPQLARLKDLLLSLETLPLRTLAECFLEDDALMTGLCAAPAGVKAHHAYMGGLIEHVVGMSEVADRLCFLYPALNRDLLLLGVLLHDLGKVRELSWDPTLAYTDEGQLLGHINIAVEMLNEKLKLAESRLGQSFDAESVLRLKHMILSHHGALGFGSPVLPMTPEAITLHYIDNLDARLNEFTRSIADDLNGDSAWTPFSPRLERRLFKGHNRSSEQA